MKTLLALSLLLVLQTVNLFSWQKYELPCDAHLLETSRSVLIGEIGTREQNNRNDGREIEKYLEPLSLPKGSAYCVAGQYYCFYKAVKLLGYPFVANPLPRTGSSIKLFLYAKHYGAKRNFQTSIDDLVIWQRGKTIFGHTERIIEVLRKGWIKTIGFNTRKYDSGEKRWVEGVFIWNRNLLHPLGRLHLIGVVGFRKVKNVH